MTQQGSGSESDVKLYAGKFKTVEELEVGYKNSAAVYDENQALKTKVNELSQVPDAYMNPSDIEIDQNRISDIQARAKEAGMTQAQYEKFVRSDKQRVDKHKQNFESLRKEIGEETINILSDYVSKNYPKEIHDTMVNTFIANKEARTAALNHRSQLLNNTVPGMNKPAQPRFNVTEEDVKKAYAAKEKDPHNTTLRNAYINILNQRAEQLRTAS